MADFLVFVGFGAMVWAGSVTLLYIMATRELAELRIKDQKSASEAKWYRDQVNQQEKELQQLKKENARLDTNLWLCREYAKKRGVGRKS